MYLIFIIHQIKFILFEKTSIWNDTNNAIIEIVCAEISRWCALHNISNFQHQSNLHEVMNMKKMGVRRKGAFQMELWLTYYLRSSTNPDEIDNCSTSSRLLVLKMMDRVNNLTIFFIKCSYYIVLHQNPSFQGKTTTPVNYFT